MNHNEGDDKRMAIKGLGMDAVELSRIEKIVAEPKSFLGKVLTPKELGLELDSMFHFKILKY